MKRLFLAIAFAFSCSLPALAGMPQRSMMIVPPVTVQLDAQNGSGETGTATLEQHGSDVVVTVKMNDSASPTQPIHIHPGTCAQLNPKPRFPLTNLKDGSSTTTLPNVNLRELQNGNFAINVHKSADDVATYVACGDIPKAF